MINWSFLGGYKTYIIGAIVVIVTGLHGGGYIDAGLYQALVAILGALGLWTLSAKGNKIFKNINGK